MSAIRVSTSSGVCQFIARTTIGEMSIREQTRQDVPRYQRQAEENEADTWCAAGRGREPGPEEDDRQERRAADNRLNDDNRDDGPRDPQGSVPARTRRGQRRRTTRDLAQRSH